MFCTYVIKFCTYNCHFVSLRQYEGLRMGVSPFTNKITTLASFMGMQISSTAFSEVYFTLRTKCSDMMSCNFCLNSPFWGEIIESEPPKSLPTVFHHEVHKKRIDGYTRRYYVQNTRSSVHMSSCSVQKTGISTKLQKN